MVPDEGIEPPTFGLQNRCTTAVLIRRRIFALAVQPRRHKIPEKERPRLLGRGRPAGPGAMRGNRAPASVPVIDVAILGLGYEQKANDESH